MSRGWTRAVRLASLRTMDDDTFCNADGASRQSSAADVTNRRQCRRGRGGKGNCPTLPLSFSLSGKCFPKDTIFWVGNFPFNLGAKLKFWTPTIYSVGNLQLFVEKWQLPAPPTTFLTHAPQIRHPGPVFFQTAAINVCYLWFPSHSHVMITVRKNTPQTKQSSVWLCRTLLSIAVAVEQLWCLLDWLIYSSNAVLAYLTFSSCLLSAWLRCVCSCETD